MSFESLLIHLCTIQRAAHGVQDGYGTPVKTWSDLYVNHPCRLVTTQGTEVRAGAEVYIIYDELIINALDITVQDRVVIGTDTYDIIMVKDLSDFSAGHHQQLYLRRVS